METLGLLSLSSDKSSQNKIESIQNSSSSCLLPHNPLTSSVSLGRFGHSHKFQLTNRQRLIASSLIYAQFWIAACVSLQAPFFPREAELKGVTPTEYGLTFGIYELTILVMSPFFGGLVTRYSPVSICELGFLLCGASTIVFGWINQFENRYLFIFSAYIIRITEGASAAALLTSSYTIMADKFPDDVASAFAYLEASFGFGLIIGPTVGGALYELGGFRYPFVVLGAFLCLGFFLVRMLLGQERDMHSSQQTKNSLSFFEFVADPAILYDACSIITSLFFIGFNAATLEPHLRQFNLTPFFTGLVFIITGSIYAISTPIWGRLCSMNYSPKHLILYGSILSTLGIMFLGPLPLIQFEPSLPVIVISLFVIGLGIAAKMVCAFVDAMDETIRKRKLPNNVSTYGLVSAMFFSSCSIGAFLGPSLGGLLIDTIQYRSATIFVLGVEFCMILFGISSTCKRTKKNTVVIPQNM